MRLFLAAFLALLFIPATAQQDSIPKAGSKQFEPNFTAVDSLYREDQFYASFTYNIITNLPREMSQNKFSVGVSGGFLRDFPVNKQRNVAIALGLGYTLQNYNYNLIVSQTPTGVTYEYIGDDLYYEKNKLSLNYVDLPVEFRWRTSVPESHKFWRIYTGLKFSYLFNSRSKFTGVGGKNLVINNSDLNPFRFSTYVAAGYNTWNFYACYGINPIFRRGSVGSQQLEISSLSVGLMFYIL
ncbi:MAG: PorT family protein [Chitinophagaceae bacterium]|nr:MAG: PorT family protein [Chitinophagaceae bacterium]